ncbi:hypothetical protein EDB19DRAFT_1836208 [Suillus lakei]|nr:hypothetical protein EDB19DRAFT_1836208 [Suillus lakei]
MFTPRFAILALFTFLAGANAGCATCQETLEVDGVATYELVSDYVKSDNGFTVCNYVDEKGDVATCEYAVRDFYAAHHYRLTRWWSSERRLVAGWRFSVSAVVKDGWVWMLSRI